MNGNLDEFITNNSISLVLTGGVPPTAVQGRLESRFLPDWRLANPVAKLHETNESTKVLSIIFFSLVYIYDLYLFS